MSSVDATLASLQQAAASTGAALAAARAAAPEETTASDDSGAVVVSVDRRGMPVESVLDKIGEMLLGAAAPVAFFFRASDWHGEVGGPSSGVAASVNPNALRATRDWTGDAATVYMRSITGQTTAATAIQTVSASTATSLVTCAVAGLAFYVAIGVILVKLIVAAIAALGSVVFSWAGVALIVEEAAVNTGLIIAAITTLVAVLGAQGNAIVQIKGAVSSGAAFPGGTWPKGTA